MAELEPMARPVTIRPAAPSPAGYTDADFTISAEAADRLINAPAENTKLAHDWDWGEFERWCATQGRIPLPATAQTLLDYVTYLMGQREPRPLAPASIDRAMGSIRAIHTERGYACSAPTAANGPTTATGPARQPPSRSTRSGP
jgi:hypothetical protein